MLSSKASLIICTLLLISPRLASLWHTKHKMRLWTGLATYRAASCWMKRDCNELFLNASLPNSIYSWQMLASTAACECKLSSRPALATILPSTLQKRLRGTSCLVRESKERWDLHDTLNLRAETLGKKSFQLGRIHHLKGLGYAFLVLACYRCLVLHFGFLLTHDHVATFFLFLIINSYRP